MEYRKILEFGVFETGLRNIVAQVEGTELILELIPELILDTSDEHLNEFDEEIREIFAESKPIVESDKLLRLEFDQILVFAVDSDINEDLFGGLHNNWNLAPKLPSGSYYPLLEICNSPWKLKLPDYRGQNDENIHHIRAISMECSFDILGYFPTGSWLRNTR